MKTTSRYQELINGFSNKRILVIGDFMLDVYLKGTSTRLCPEAPVPIVDVQEKTVLPGGAGNTVCNLRALGASVTFCTVIGCDAEGDEAIHLLERMHVDGNTVVRNAGRKTITKSRVMAGSQVVARIDDGSEDAIDAATSETLVGHIEKRYGSYDAIVVSDYGKGVITEVVLDKLCKLRKRTPGFLAVDSKRLQLYSSLRASYAKPNYLEAVTLLGLQAVASQRAEQISQHAGELFQTVNAPIITVTLDGDGSVLIENGKAIGVCPAPPIAKPQVAGAGDSYFSGFALAYIGSENVIASAEVATAAASIAIRKDGTSTCSLAELKTHFSRHSKYVANIADLGQLCAAYRREGKRIVFTNGCFDILHSGHVMYLRRAKELGDVLIVAINTDDSIKRIKGKDRPINTLADRLQVLEGLSSVDHIVPFGEEHDDTPIPLIQVVRPHVFAKGGDYTKADLPEAPTVEGCGGEIVLLDHVPDHSTTRIINRISRISHPVQEPIFDHDDLEPL